jgi:hypothetical protein
MEVNMNARLKHKFRLFQYMKYKLEEETNEKVEIDLQRSLNALAKDLYYDFKATDYDTFTDFLNGLIDVISEQAELRIESYYRPRLDYLMEEIGNKYSKQEENNNDNSRNQSAE